MNKDYTSAGAFYAKITAVLFLGSALWGGSIHAQTSKSEKKTNPKEQQATPQTDSRWEKGGLFEGFSPNREIKEKRTRNSKHFYNADGSITAQIGRPLHYQDAQGLWQDIDLRVIRSNRPGYGLANEANAIKSYFPQVPGQTGVAMLPEQGPEFRFWLNPSLAVTRNGQTVKQYQPQAATASAQGEGLLYNQVYPGISEEFVVLGEGLENNTIIHSLTPEMAALAENSVLEFSQFIPLGEGWQVMAEGRAQTSAFEAERFSIRIPGMENGIHFGKIVVFDHAVNKEDALRIAHSPAEKLDAADKDILAKNLYTISYLVRFVNGGMEVLTRLPAGWLQASGRSFPVVIDPTVTITPTGASGDVNGPLTHWYGYQRHADLYLQSEIGAYGFITQIEYNRTGTGTAGSRPTKVYMRTTPVTTLTSMDAWNSTTYTGAGATLCLDANTDQGSTAGWKALALTTPFTYNQDNLMVMVSDSWGGSGSSKDYNMSSTMTARQAYIREDGTDPGDGATIEDIEDYLPEIRITYNNLTTCTGVPALGAATASSTSVCSGTGFTLNLPGAPTEGGISYQWQSSTDGTVWNNLGSAQIGSAYATSQTQTTQYRVIVTCTPASVSDTSDAVTVNMGLPTDCYCTPATSNCGLDDEIQNVTFASINNNSTCSANGYQSYVGTMPAASVTAGLSYPISVTMGDGGGESVAVWIDYNQNGTFEMSEYILVGAIEPGGTVTNTINIPGSAMPGNTRMRVRSFYISEPDDDPLTVWTDTPNSSCDIISTGYGETEDYAITIVAGTACAGTPVAGAAQASVSAVCAATPFNLSLSGSGTETGLTYQWQQSPDGTAWSNLGAVQNFPGYTVTNQTANTQYRVIVTCTNGGVGDTSTAVTVTQNPLANCVCTPLLDCTDNDVILNVTFESINNTSTCGTNGYSNYAGTVAAPTVEQGSTYPISVTVGDGWASESVSVWIDYNHNGTFEANEFTYIATGSDEAVTGNISIPATSLTGDALMRVRVAAVGAGAATDDMPCDEEQEYGETEDYLINIIAPVPGGIDSLVVTTLGGVPASIPSPTGTLQLVATVYPASEPQTVTWSIVPGTGTASINTSGLVTGLTAGTVWGKAVSTVDATQMDSLLITINAAPAGIDSVTVNTAGGVPAVIPTPTGTLQLEATVYPTSEPQTVTWSIVPGTGTATINTSGLVTGLTAGTVWGKAVSTVDATKMDSILITINATPAGIDSVVANTVGGVPAVISTPGGSLALQAVVYPASQPQTVTWSIVPGTGTATISTSGVVTAQTNGTVWGKAVSTVDATKMDSILITITNQDMSVGEWAAFDFTLYPNPTQDVVTVKTGKSHPALHLQVMDITGKVLISRNVPANELSTGVTVDLTNMASGTYLLKLQGENIHVNKRVIRR